MIKTSYPSIESDDVIIDVSHVIWNDVELLEPDTKVGAFKFVGTDDEYPTIVLLFGLSPFEFLAVICILYWASWLRESKEYDVIKLFVSFVWRVDEDVVKSK